jgi:putative secretion ATPase (PEP-CTERM system associated)
MFETFYGFSGNPFQLNPDPTFFFASRGHAKAHAYLKYGVFQREGFIVITGEVGAGKTTLVRALLQELDPSTVVAAQLVSTQLDSDNLLRAVAIAFGLAVEGAGKASLLATIEAFLTSLVAQNRRALLVVDEAQNLSQQALEELRMLSNFQLGDRALLQSFLVGQPELRELMRSPAMLQLRQRIIASYHLGPMEREETRGYIEHRLRRVGWNGDPSFEDAVFPALHDATGGIPRRINALCNRVLLGAYLGEKHEITARDVTETDAELQEELGGAPQVAEAADAGRSTGSPADWGRSSDVVRPFVISSIAARLDRLERSVNTMLELLRAMAGPERRTRAGGKFGGR